MRRSYTFVFAIFFGNCSFLMSSISMAGVVFAPAATYKMATTNDDTTTFGDKSNSNALWLDLKLGYSMPGGLYVGGIYATESGTNHTEVANVKDDDNLSASRLGVSIGYLSGNLYVMGHYFLSAERTIGDEDGSTVIRSDGSGFQVDLGWAFQVSVGVAIGPQLSYNSLVYKKTQSGGTTTNKNFTITAFDPMLALVVMF